MCQGESIENCSDFPFLTNGIPQNDAFGEPGETVRNNNFMVESPLILNEPNMQLPESGFEFIAPSHLNEPMLFTFSSDPIEPNNFENNSLQNEGINEIESYIEEEEKLSQINDFCEEKTVKKKLEGNGSLQLKKMNNCLN